MEFKNKEVRNEYFRNYHKNKRRELHLKAIELLGNECSRCHEKDWRCLQIDHIKGHGYSQKRKYSCAETLYRHIISDIMNESKDYQCLCANCNWIKKYERNETAYGDN
jgi:hypothetical protein